MVRLSLSTVASVLLVVWFQVSTQADTTAGTEGAQPVHMNAVDESFTVTAKASDEGKEDTAEETSAVEPDQRLTKEQAVVLLEHLLNGSSAESAKGRTRVEAALTEGSVTVVAAQTWAACGLFDGTTKVVRQFERYRGNAGGQYISGGVSNLACGSSNWGYRHIKQEHMSQWEYVAAIVGQNWRDTADDFVAAALIDPDTVTYRSKNSTFTYCRAMYLIDKRYGRPVGLNYPRVVVARVTKNIITAFPNSSRC